MSTATSCKVVNLCLAFSKAGTPTENNLQQGYDQLNHISPRSTKELCLVQDSSCFVTASGCSSIVINSAKEKQYGESSHGWLYSEPNVHGESLNESAAQELVLKKRSSLLCCCLLNYTKSPFPPILCMNDIQ